MQRIWKEIDFALHFFGYLDLDSPGEALSAPVKVDSSKYWTSGPEIVSRILCHRVFCQVFFQAFNFIGLIGSSWLLRKNLISISAQVSILFFLISSGLFTRSHRLFLSFYTKLLVSAGEISQPRPQVTEKMIKEERSAQRMMAFSRVAQSIGFYAIFTELAFARI